MEAFECDIADVLQKDDRIVLQKLVQWYQEFRSCVAAKIEERFNHEKNCTKQTSINTEKMSELQKEIDTVKTNIDDTVLQQKIIDREIANVIKSQESLQEDLDKAKAKKSTLSLEIMDIQLVLEERRKKKAKQWDAIKRACSIYKNYLDIHIGIEEEEDRQRIKFSFFAHSKDTNKYFIKFSRSKDGLTVEQVEPKLSKEDFNKLSNISESPEHFQVSDIILFLCQVRNIYLKHVKARRKEQNS